MKGHERFEAELQWSHIGDDIFKFILMYEKCCIVIRLSSKFVPEGPINTNRALVQSSATNRRLNQICFSLLTHICVTGLSEST